MHTPGDLKHSKHHEAASRNDAKKTSKKPPRSVSAKKKQVSIPESPDGTTKRRGSISMTTSVPKVVTLLRPRTPEAKTIIDRPTSAPLNRPSASEPQAGTTTEEQQNPVHTEVKESSSSEQQQTLLEEQEPPMSEEEVSALLLDIKKRIIDMDVTFGKLKQAINMVDMRTPCMLCGFGYRDIILMPCNHNVTCAKCAQFAKLCPYCTRHISQYKPRVKTPEEVDQATLHSHKLLSNFIKILTALKKESKKEQLQFAKKPPTETEMRKFKLEELFNVKSLLLRSTDFFKHFDSDSSGFIEKNELQSFMKRFIYQGLELSEDELMAALEVVDTNKDGKISPEEFVEFMTTLTGAMNTADFNKAVKDCIESTRNANS